MSYYSFNHLLLFYAKLLSLMHTIFRGVVLLFYQIASLTSLIPDEDALLSFSIIGLLKLGYDMSGILPVYLIFIFLIKLTTFKYSKNK